MRLNLGQWTKWGGRQVFTPTELARQQPIYDPTGLLVLHRRALMFDHMTQTVAELRRQGVPVQVRLCLVVECPAPLILFDSLLGRS